MFGNVNEILYCMKLDCDCVVQVRHQMSQGRNANYILKRMKKDAATVVYEHQTRKFVFCLVGTLPVHCSARMACFLQ